MYYCKECENLFDDEDLAVWTDDYGEELCGCPNCLGGADEVNPCEICGDYPEEDYENWKLPYAGICKECFNDGIRTHLLEYLDTLDHDLQLSFYGITEGFAADTSVILAFVKDGYREYVKTLQELAPHGMRDIYAKWIEFINDTDAQHFAYWLIQKLTKR